jgi:hypothetical protein
MGRKIDTDAVINNIINIVQSSNPATPAAGHSRTFVKSDGLYLIDESGVVTGPFGSGGGAVSTLLSFNAFHAEYPAANFATFDMRNLHAVLDFDDTTNQSIIFSAILPRTYPGSGLKVWLHFALETAVTGNVIWNVAFERIGEVQDIDSDNFVTAQSTGAVTVPGTSGIIEMASISFSDGAQIGGLLAGEGFRIKVTRDAVTDTAVDDAELLYIEIEAT